MNYSNKTEKILSQSIQKYADDKGIPSWQVNGLIRQTDEIKEKLLSLSESEKQILLSCVSSQELSHLKNILQEVQNNEQSDR